MVQKGLKMNEDQRKQLDSTALPSLHVTDYKKLGFIYKKFRWIQIQTGLSPKAVDLIVGYIPTIYSRSLVNCRIKWLFSTAVGLYWIWRKFKRPCSIQHLLDHKAKTLPRNTNRISFHHCSEINDSFSRAFSPPLSCKSELYSTELLFKENKLKLRLLKLSWGTIQGLVFCSPHKTFKALNFGQEMYTGSGMLAETTGVCSCRQKGPHISWCCWCGDGLVNRERFALC